MWWVIPLVAAVAILMLAVAVAVAAMGLRGLITVMKPLNYKVPGFRPGGEKSAPVRPEETD